jgi:hypothetical protein
VLEHGFGDVAVSGFVPVDIAFDEVPGVYDLGRLAADEYREEVEKTDVVLFRKCPPERDRDAFQVFGGELVTATARRRKRLDIGSRR